MLVLALETATPRTSVVVAEDGRELAAWRELTHQDLCRRLAAETGEVLRRAARAFADLDLVAVGLGPGSFTATRVGLATAKGFALAHDLPLVGISSLAAMAWASRAPVTGLVCPVLDAKRGEVYGALYRVEQGAVEEVRPAFVATAADLTAQLSALGEPVTILAESDRLPPDIRAALRDLLWPEPVWPDATAIAELGQRRFAERGGDELGPLRPIYVRMSYAEESLHLDLGLR
jgi:tRNA threonylcarbamoyladenosine biosynthesis protein TsaB